MNNLRVIALLGPLLAACLIPPQQGQGGNYGGGGPPPSGGGEEGGAPGPSGPSGPSGGPPPMSRPAPTPSGPTIVSMRLHSDCSKTVKVFYGDKPKFGSGTLSSISSNSTESHQFKAGDMFWIVDESENGITSATIGANMHEIVIGSGCTSMSAR